MQQENLLTANIFELRLKWLVPFSACVFVAVLLLGSQKLLLRLPGPAAMITVFFLFFILICQTAGYLTDKLATAMRIAYPTFILWCYPMTVVSTITACAWLFLGLSNQILGRGFWNSWLGLTGQDTTSFFFACFASMLVAVTLQFASSLIHVFNWILEISRGNVQRFSSELMKNVKESPSSLGNALESLRYDGEQIRNNRVRATRLNRMALLCVFILSLAFFGWVVFFRPALILYYRAEIQLRTFLEPAAAYETLRHLTERFPNYRYLDSVTYRMAWILDRRLNEYDKAKESYVAFIERFGRTNVWSDEAIASLVRLSLDKLNNPDQALYWTSEYLTTSPEGIMAPHMYLYRIRAFKLKNQAEQAQSEIEAAQKLFASRKIQVINSEDRLIDLISFADAVQAEISADWR
ncbi:MAG TPA: hypothetical protein DCG57_17290 [Candidatus Riflebacteria bacterium]|jgi:tetratricopeptide (TPR) repeat protein|nr:hypothetical protein [Candidatus Riflebacteria bacterium]